MAEFAPFTYDSLRPQKTFADQLGAQPMTYNMLLQTPEFQGDTSWQTKKTAFDNWMQTDGQAILRPYGEKQRELFTSEVRKAFAKDFPQPTTGLIRGTLDIPVVALEAATHFIPDVVAAGGRFVPGLSDETRATIAKGAQSLREAIPEKIHGWRSTGSQEKAKIAAERMAAAGNTPEQIIAALENIWDAPVDFIAQFVGSLGPVLALAKGGVKLATRGAARAEAGAVAGSAEALAARESAERIAQVTVPLTMGTGFGVQGVGITRQDQFEAYNGKNKAGQYNVPLEKLLDDPEFARMYEQTGDEQGTREYFGASGHLGAESLSFLTGFFEASLLTKALGRGFGIGKGSIFAPPQTITGGAAAGAASAGVGIGGQQIASNLAIQSAYPETGLWDNVAGAVTMGVVGGAVLGGAFGAAGNRATRPTTEKPTTESPAPEKSTTDTAPTPEEQAAGVMRRPEGRDHTPLTDRELELIRRGETEVFNEIQTGVNSGEVRENVAVDLIRASREVDDAQRNIAEARARSNNFRDFGDDVAAWMENITEAQRWLREIVGVDEAQIRRQTNETDAQYNSRLMDMIEADQNRDISAIVAKIDDALSRAEPITTGEDRANINAGVNQVPNIPGAEGGGLATGAIRPTERTGGEGLVQGDRTPATPEPVRQGGARPEDGTPTPPRDLADRGTEAVGRVGDTRLADATGTPRVGERGATDKLATTQRRAGQPRDAGETVAPSDWAMGVAKERIVQQRVDANLRGNNEGIGSQRAAIETPMRVLTEAGVSEGLVSRRTNESHNDYSRRLMRAAEAVTTARPGRSGRVDMDTVVANATREQGKRVRQPARDAESKWREAFTEPIPKPIRPLVTKAKAEHEKASGRKLKKNEAPPAPTQEQVRNAVEIQLDKLPLADRRAILNQYPKWRDEATGRNKILGMIGEAVQSKHAPTKEGRAFWNSLATNVRNAINRLMDNLIKAGAGIALAFGLHFSPMTHVEAAPLAVPTPIMAQQVSPGAPTTPTTLPTAPTEAIIPRRSNAVARAEAVRAKRFVTRNEEIAAATAKLNTEPANPSETRKKIIGSMMNTFDPNAVSPNDPSAAIIALISTGEVSVAPVQPSGVVERASGLLTKASDTVNELVASHQLPYQRWTEKLFPGLGDANPLNIAKRLLNGVMNENIRKMGTHLEDFGLRMYRLGGEKFDMAFMEIMGYAANADSSIKGNHIILDELRVKRDQTNAAWEELQARPDFKEIQNQAHHPDHKLYVRTRQETDKALANYEKYELELNTGWKNGDEAQGPAALRGGLTPEKARAIINAAKTRYGDEMVDTAIQYHYDTMNQIRETYIALTGDTTLRNFRFNKYNGQDAYLPSLGRFSDNAAENFLETLKRMGGFEKAMPDVFRAAEGRTTVAEPAFVQLTQAAQMLGVAAAYKTWHAPLVEAIRANPNSGAHIVASKAAVPDKHKEFSIAIPRVVIEPDGTSRTAFDHVYWDDNRIAQSLKQATVGQLGAGAQFLASTTRWLAAPLVRLNPVYPVINAMRNPTERIFNILARDIKLPDGTPISKWQLVKDFSWAMIQPDMYRQIKNDLWGGAKAVGPNSKFGQLWREFVDIGGPVSIADMWPKMHDRLLTDAMGLSRRQLRLNPDLAQLGKRIVEQFDKLQRFSDYGSSAALYYALRKQGVDSQVAAFRVRDLFDPTHKGRLTPLISTAFPFAGSAFTGGANLMRTLKTPKGFAMFVAATAAMSMIYEASRNAAEDDPDFGNALDQMNVRGINGFPIEMGENKWGIIPWGYGIPQLSWALAVMGSRVRRGLATEQQAISEVLHSFSWQVSPINLPQATGQPLKDAAMMFTPFMFQPIMRVNMNRNAFGGQIVYANPNDGDPMYEKGRRGTEQAYKNLAKKVYDVTGGTVDYAPEQLKELVNGYMVGPLRTIPKVFFSEPGREGRPLSATEDMSAFWAAVGVPQLYKYSNRAKEQAFYSRMAMDKDKKRVQTYNAKMQQLSSAASKRIRAHGFTTDTDGILEDMYDKRLEIMREYMQKSGGDYLMEVPDEM